MLAAGTAIAALSLTAAPATAAPGPTAIATVQQEQPTARSAPGAESGTVAPANAPTVIGGTQLHSTAGPCPVAMNVYGAGGTPHGLIHGACGHPVGTTQWFADSALTVPVGSSTTASPFPTTPYTLVQYNGNGSYPPHLATPTGTIRVGSPVALPVGAGICKAGPTSGLTCGTVQAHNQTVAFPQGTLPGVSRASLCPETGDTGRMLVAANTGRVVGLIVGGAGNCTSGGITFYLPIQPILAQYGVVPFI
ncbi:S1 family peptidase [Streptomyces lonarensis]|uniref:S1 family peptidase n=1 Tax=Streptomyces lonarensis TaxID=700599 RepID=UPI0030C77DA2